jgi:hypothetical protein
MRAVNTSPVSNKNLMIGTSLLREMLKCMQTSSSPIPSCWMLSSGSRVIKHIAKFRKMFYYSGRMAQQRTYEIDPIFVNGITINRVVIDSHYEEKHSEYMNDDLILKLVLELNGRRELPDTKTTRYSYFATLIELDKKQYRLIWLLEDHAIYIGVVNAYRDKRRR